ncbi:hypothetical protein ACQVP2_07720 [Methylobacterium aquaticum]|uniref:hypothetical protein n=1 Tax=Methylobacterium aquaticum TaxID=270351 RepID=UPI003D172294
MSASPSRIPNAAPAIADQIMVDLVGHPAAPTCAALALLLGRIVASSGSTDMRGVLRDFRQVAQDEFARVRRTQIEGRS